MYNLEKSPSPFPSSGLARGCSSTQPEATLQRCSFKYRFLITATANRKSQNLGYVQDLRKFKPAAPRNSHLSSLCTSHGSLEQFFSVSPALLQIKNPGASHTQPCLHSQAPSTLETSIWSRPYAVTSLLGKWITQHGNRSCLLSY